MSHAGHTVPAPEGFVPHTVAHHFESQEQEYQSAKLGFWLFMATEILLFGGLFAAYFYYHGAYPQAFAEGGSSLNWKLGALNTVVLLASSFTMAMGVRASQLSKNRSLMIYLVLTLIGAGIFMVVKYIEYSGKFAESVGPGVFLMPKTGEGAHYAHLFGQDGMSIFMALYFTMTGIHGIHVLVGMFLITWVLVRASKKHFHAKHYMPVDLVGIYWHLVDLIWIFLFPLLYLVP